MRTHLSGLDHCCVLVGDLERARATWTRLGFNVSGLGRHGPAMGTGNHNVMLTGNYIELLGVLTSTEFSQEITHQLDSGEGIGAVALVSDDVAGAVEEMRASGIPSTDAFPVARSVPLPLGDVEAAFTFAYLGDLQPPQPRFFCSQALTPEYMWRPDLMEHPNTAYAIAALTIVTDAPQQLSEDFGRIVDADPESIGGGRYLVPTGGAPLIYSTTEALADRFAGADLAGLPKAGPAALSVQVYEMAAAEQWLHSRDVAYARCNDELVISARQACGVLLTLTENAR
jgi:catechol 2,3-dioxygenase-like lactoylglutathione lyase family enzyme